MTLLVQKPSGAKLLMRQTWAPADADAAAYIAAVEAADGQALEEKTRKAIDDFVIGCKADGIWSAIKASCILAGARTLTGALVPLVGAAPTNVGPFVSGDYNRKTGLVGDGSTKYLNSNRAGNADPQNSLHLSAYVTENFAANQILVDDNGGSNVARISRGTSSRFFFFSRNSTAAVTTTLASGTGFLGSSRTSATNVNARSGGSPASGTSTSAGQSTNNFWFYSQSGGTPSGSGRLAFYSIGESLDLTLLDARVTQLITTFAAVIP